METNEEKKLTFAPGAMSRIVSAVSTSSAGTPKDLRRRGCTVTIFPEQCIPGVLIEPIRVGLEELNSEEELRAYKASGGITIAVDSDGGGSAPKEVSISQQALMVGFAREAVRLVNGERLTADEKAILWNVLDMNGRMVLGNAYMAACTGGHEAVGFLDRSLASLEVW